MSEGTGGSAVPITRTRYFRAGLSEVARFAGWSLVATFLTG